APAARTLRCRADCVGSWRPARSRGDQGDRSAAALRKAASRVRQAARGDRRRTRDHRTADGRDPAALRHAVTRPLLAIDGDSFAHRAYHALPKSIRHNAVVGFTNMIVRLWDAEEPRAVLV